MFRKLSPNLAIWFDSRLLNPAPPAFCEPKNPIDMLVLTAQACEGITEEAAGNRGRMVELFQSTIGKAEGEPWCMSFIQSCVAYVESFGFKSDLFSSEHVLTVWTHSKCEKPLEPQSGDIVCYQFGETIKGHAEIITQVGVNFITTMGGNTSSNGAKIDREGDGVYRKSRPKKDFMRSMKLLGYLRPFAKT